MAYYLNKAMVIGNLTRDPEMKTLQTGVAVANFSVATNRSFTDRDGNKRDEVEYHNVVVWGKLAEICGQYLGKGRKVYVEGRLQTRSWEGQDGVTRNRTEIIAENVIMLDRAPQGASANTEQYSEGFRAQKQNQGFNKANKQNDSVSAVRQPQAPIQDLPTITLDDMPQDDGIRIEDIPF